LIDSKARGPLIVAVMKGCQQGRGAQGNVGDEADEWHWRNVKHEACAVPKIAGPALLDHCRAAGDPINVQAMLGLLSFSGFSSSLACPQAAT
jgi:hypothetical protein